MRVFILFLASACLAYCNDQSVRDLLAAYLACMASMFLKPDTDKDTFLRLLSNSTVILTIARAVIWMYSLSMTAYPLIVVYILAHVVYNMHNKSTIDS